MRPRLARALLAVIVCAGLAVAASAAAPKKSASARKFTPSVKAKPLSDNVKRGLAWLAKTQQESGGWSQGEESEAMGHSLDEVRDKPNVADTCMAALALMRAGSTPKTGLYAANVRRAVEFVCSQVEEADQKSLYVTSVRGTRVQMKLGSYIDTFLASMLLTEAKDRMPDKKGNNRVAAALDKVLYKIEKNQRENGTWDDQGWAPVLQQSIASKAINRVAQRGVKVDEKVRERAETYARSQFDRSSGAFKAEGSAGVALYSAGGNLGSMQQSANTNAALADKVRKDAESAPTAAARKAAQEKLARFQSNDEDLRAAQDAITRRLDDQQFISGFGSNGGEEFLSYMNIGESLVIKGGKDWEKWDKSITENLNRVQNKDGTWTGHHCITGRTFCTAAALMVLTTDRAPMPVANTIARK